ncbi:MAG: aldo/keto reductase [Candidatus Hydrogenedentes bacterium]|nr:aldo/keto reductase [Candidatus Hydrogenedentota bacterium]
MEKRAFGNTDMDLSVLGFGAAEIGYEGASEEEVRSLLNEALDAGLNIIDTAECYMNSEEMIGNTVSNRRDDYYLFTKCGHPQGNVVGEDWSRASILSSIERSLRRLQTDHVDLVLLHSCAEDVLRNGEAIGALQKARDLGYTRYIGYSGDSMAARYAIECGEFDALEISVSIADQEAIGLTLSLAEEQKLGVIVKRPIANVAWKTSELPKNPYHQVYWERLQKLDYDFVKGDVSEAVGIALRFTLGVPGVHTLIVGTAKPGRWRENAAFLEEGPLSAKLSGSIQSRWKEVASDTWIGQA